MNQGITWDTSFFQMLISRINNINTPEWAYMNFHTYPNNFLEFRRHSDIASDSEQDLFDLRQIFH